MFESITAPTRPNWKVRIVLAIVSFGLGAGCISLWRMTQMPMRSFTGVLPPLTVEQAGLASRLSEEVKYLSETIGERSNQRSGSLYATVQYLRGNLDQAGYAVAQQDRLLAGHVVSNLEAQLVGAESAAGTIVVGAHYDSVGGTVGANDNASGVAATLEVARLLKGSHLRRTVRFVFFVNEEPPYFQTEDMGSMVYAGRLRRDGVPVSAMISLETIGYYSDAAGSQKYPAALGLFYPNRGNFIGFVGNSESRDFVRKAIRAFRDTAQFPSEGVAAPSSWPGIGWSDQWSFWQQGYKAIMVTDSAPFRYPYYHTELDTIDKIDFEKMSRVVSGVRTVVASLANEP